MFYSVELKPLSRLLGLGTVSQMLRKCHSVSETADGSALSIPSSFARISGEFGMIEIGQRDPIHARTHYAAAFGAGVGLNAGDM